MPWSPPWPAQKTAPTVWLYEPPKQEDNTQTPEPAPAPTGASEITLWTYPIGKWGDEATVKALTDAFTAETGIAVKVDYLAYALMKSSVVQVWVSRSRY